MDITPKGLSAGAACFQGIPPGYRDAVIIYLLAQLAGSTMTPAQLSSAARCYQFGDRKTAEGIIIYLLGTIATAAGA